MERRSLRTVLERRAGFTSAPLAPDLAVHLTREVLSHLHSLDQPVSTSQVFLSSAGDVSLFPGSNAEMRPFAALLRTLLLGDARSETAVPDDVREVLARLESFDASRRFTSLALCDLALAQCQGPISAGRGQVAALYREATDSDGSAAQRSPTPADGDFDAEQLSPDGASGTLELLRPPRVDEKAAVPTAALEDSAPLELAPVAPRVVQERVEVFREAPPPARPPSRGIPLMLMLFLTLFIAAGVFLVWPQTAPPALAQLLPELQRKLHTLLDRPAPTLQSVLAPHKGPVHTLILDSSPTGAQVEVNGQPLGRTPVAVENRYGPGRQNVRMKQPGYQPWQGTFEGDEDAAVQAILKRR